ncbi:MAG TPA: hypothetical protein VKW78_17325 [Terriglobales bacterium]|jgi:hypothetical protein|nr:hypothetical protein [Terriglobales bacterium]
MTDQEATETWAALSALLTKFELADVLRRVEAYLREGKPEEREIEQLEERPDTEGRLFHVEGFRRRPGPRARYLAVVEYTPQERLQILVEATLHAVVFPRQMEHEIWNHLEKSSDSASNPIDVQTIRVVHETIGGEPTVATLGRQTPVVDLSKLQKALQEISREAQK